MSITGRLTNVSVIIVSSLSLAQVAQAKTIDLVVSLKGRVPVETLAQNAIEFGVTYTPDQIRKLSGPSDSDYTNLIENLKQQGFTIVTESKSHLTVVVRGEQSMVEDAFQTRLEESNGVRKAMTSASVPAHLNLIDAISGLDSGTKRHHHHQIMMNGSKPMDNFADGISPTAIKAAYNFTPVYKAGFTGKGQSIAVATYDGFKLTDITTYYKNIGLTRGGTVDQVMFNGTPTYDINSAGETELDAEFSGMIAPNANVHVYASAENSDAGEAAIFTKILSDNKAKQVNYSWGNCETNVTPAHKVVMDKIFAQAVAQGVNIQVASGDSGSDGCQDGGTVAGYPDSNPNVNAIGGTSLVNKGGVFETAWSPTDQINGSSGGGISSLYAIPSYQAGAKAPFNKMRSTPDFSFNADPMTGEPAWINSQDQTTGVESSQWIIIGGTSIAAPQWTGYLALVNEARVSKKLATLGFLNPIVYKMNTTAATYSSCFHDTTSGNNGAYQAVKGWDAVTGWGSLNAGNLFTQLTAH